MNRKFDEIRSYRDKEVNAILLDLPKDPEFRYILQKIYTDDRIDNLFNELREINTVFEFQTQYISEYINKLIDFTMTDFKVKGVENLEQDKAYLFISNHRDIILDSALINEVLVRNNLQTSEIGIGNNLLIYSWIEKLVRLNKTFIIKRDVEGRELWNSLSLVSEYIRHTIAERNTSVWIAQRQGRSKDGNDRTDPALLKMLNMSGAGTVVENFSRLNIVPVTVSYEHEPAVESKVAATYAKMTGEPYAKTQEDDLKDMGRGLYNPKGAVNLVFGKPFSAADFEPIKEEKNKTAIIELLAEEIDLRIHQNYGLSKNNYIAFDIINGCSKCLRAGKYTKEDETSLKVEGKRLLALFPGKDAKLLENIFYGIYSKPLVNKMLIP